MYPFLTLEAFHMHGDHGDAKWKRKMCLKTEPPYPKSLGEGRQSVIPDHTAPEFEQSEHFCVILSLQKTFEGL